YPYANRLVGRLGERMVIYHCVDEYASFSGMPREAVVRMERDLILRAHIVFTSAEQLCAERRAVNRNTYFVRHGVDVRHFSRALEPAEASRVPRGRTPRRVHAAPRGRALQRPGRSRRQYGGLPGRDRGGARSALGGDGPAARGGHAGRKLGGPGRGILRPHRSDSGCGGMIEVLLLACLLLLVYTHVGYAAVIGFWAALRSRPPRLRGGEPTVTVIIAAHNEAPRIAARLENLLALDYPHDHLEILLGSDGSTDGTQERARAYETRGVTVVAFEMRRGKAAVLNDLVPKAHGEILVFADARQDFEAGALRALVAPLADPEVGAVSGELVLRTGRRGRAGVGTGLGFYWRYEKFIRKSESRVDATVGVTGAIYPIP